MDERAAFLAAIAADPTAALPRLQFADWLDEHGETDAAEWLRLDVEACEAWTRRGMINRSYSDRWRQLESSGARPDGIEPLDFVRILAGWVR